MNMNYQTLIQVLSVVTSIIQGTQEDTCSITQSETVKSRGCPNGLTSLHQYCFSMITNTDSLYKCPYNNTLPFDQNMFSVINPLGILGTKLWVKAKRNPNYGYYEWTDLGDRYGTLIHEVETGTYGDCIVYKHGIKGKFLMENCDSKNTALCVYKRDDNNYWNTFDDMCNSGRLEKEKTATNECENPCGNEADDYRKCVEENVQDYPKPTIRIKFNHSNAITITIRHSLKLAVLNYGLPIYCFSDVYEPSAKHIKYRYGRDEFTVIEGDGNASLYVIKPATKAPGKYWCEGFAYPDVNKIVSNKILAKSSNSYGLNIVLNITLSITNRFTFVPYNFHTRTTRLIKSVVSRTQIQLIRPVKILPVTNTDCVDMVFHLTTKNITDVSRTYNELSSDLKNLHRHTEILNYSMASSDLCIKSIINQTEWPTVRIGQRSAPEGIHLQKNGLPITRTCLGRFTYGAHWSEINGDVSSGSYSQFTEALNVLINSNATAEELNHSLGNLLVNTDDLITFDVYLVAKILERIVQSKQHFDVRLFANNLEAMTKIERQILRIAQTELNATDIMLYNFDVALAKAGVTIATKNILARTTNIQTSDVSNIAIYEVDGKLQLSNKTNIKFIGDLNFTDLVFAAFLPLRVLQQIRRNVKNVKDVNLVTAVLSNDALFNDDNSPKSAGFVVSMFVRGFYADILDEDISIIMRSDMNKKMYCGYWKYGIDDSWTSIHGRWSIHGEAVDLDEKYKMCNYSHMTHFAFLVGAPETTILNHIVLVGCVLSMIGVTGIIITAILFKSWRDSMGTKILLNFCATILIQMTFLFISGLTGLTLTVCISVAIILHYTIISQFCWMLIISYLQYRKFVRVLVIEPNNILLKSCVFGWITPIIPVTIIASVNINSYIAKELCYLSGMGLYLGMFLPIGTVILVNIVLFVLILTSVLYKKSQAFGVKANLIALKIKLCITLFFLMGFSWIFGLLASFLHSVLLSYMFSITSTIQGLVLYFHFIIFNKTTRKLWLKKLYSIKNLFVNNENTDKRNNAGKDNSISSKIARSTETKQTSTNSITSPNKSNSI